MTEPSPEQTPERPAADEADGMTALADDVLPALIARLRASNLGELEVRSAGWRVRLRREARGAAAPITPTDAGSDAVGVQGGSVPGLEIGVARSPGVGYFSPARDMGIGVAVQAGDTLGTVDVLGVMRDVTTPIDGIISRVLAEAGQAVEYGQALADIDPLGGAAEVASDDLSAAAAAVVAD